MSTLTIAWHGLDLNVDGYNIYRSEVPMDKNDMPFPIDSVGPNVGNYRDSGVIPKRRYYYRVGAVKNGSEAIGPEYVLNAFGTYLVVGIGDKYIKKLNPENGELIWSAYVSGRPYSITCDVDGHVYVGTDTSRVRKHDSDTGDYIWQYNGLNDQCRSIVVDNDNGFLYVGSEGSEIKKLDLEGNEIWSYSEREGNYVDAVRSMDIDPEGNIYTGQNNDEMRKIDPNGKTIWVDSDYNESLRDVFYRDGYIYSASRSSLIRKQYADGSGVVWNASPNQSYAYSIVADSDGYVYSGGYGNRIQKTDPNGNNVNTGNWPFEEHTGNVSHLGIDLENYIYSGGADDYIKKSNPDGYEVWSIRESTFIDSLAVISY